VAYVEERAGRVPPPELAGDSPKYAEGDVVDVDESHARHFVNRGVAEYATRKRADRPEEKPEVKPAVK
jgi:hypothetical protein